MINAGGRHSKNYKDFRISKGPVLKDIKIFRGLGLKEWRTQIRTNTHKNLLEL